MICKFIRLKKSIQLKTLKTVYNALIGSILNCRITLYCNCWKSNLNFTNLTKKQILKIIRGKQISISSETVFPENKTASIKRTLKMLDKFPRHHKPIKHKLTRKMKIKNLHFTLRKDKYVSESCLFHVHGLKFAIFYLRR